MRIRRHRRAGAGLEHLAPAATLITGSKQYGIGSRGFEDGMKTSDQHDGMTTGQRSGPCGAGGYGCLLFRATCLCSVAPPLVFSLLAFTAIAQAGEPAAADTAPLEPVRPTAVDKTQAFVSRSVNDFAQWIDSFFDDERIVEEDATTKLRLSQAVFRERGESFRHKTNVNVKINIPRFKNRLKLFATGEDDNVETVDMPGNFSPDARGESTFGLQYFAKSTDRLNLSLTSGVKFSSPEFFIGPRLRVTAPLNGWQLRFIQRVRWFSSSGWESDTRFDAETVLARDRLFFRNTLEGRWREEDEGYRYEFRPALVQRLHSKKVIEYQWNNLFKTRPRHRLEESVLGIRYRQRIWRRWLFYEVGPQIAFRNDQNFEAKPGATLLLEVIFGGRDKARRAKAARAVATEPGLP